MYVCVHVSEHYSAKTVHSIELRFGMYITGHRFTYCVDFNEFKIKFFYRRPKRNFCTLEPMESNYKKYTSAYTMLCTKLKFNMCNVDHCSSNYNNFDVSRMYSFLYKHIGHTKYVFTIHVSAKFYFSSSSTKSHVLSEINARFKCGILLLLLS